MLNAECLRKKNKRSSLQGGDRRTSNLMRANADPDSPDDRSDDGPTIVVVKDLEALQTTCND